MQYLNQSTHQNIHITVISIIPPPPSTVTQVTQVNFLFEYLKCYTLNKLSALTLEILSWCTLRSDLKSIHQVQIGRLEDGKMIYYFRQAESILWFTVDHLRLLGRCT